MDDDGELGNSTVHCGKTRTRARSSDAGGNQFTILTNVIVSCRRHEQDNSNSP
jgi:hypothetical protein